MKTIKSRYKLWGGFTLLLLFNIVPLCGKVLIDVIMKLRMPNYQPDYGLILVILIFTVLLMLFPLLIMTQCRVITIDEERITFTNPIFPFLKKERHWAAFDSRHQVIEHSRAGTYEAIWLVKDQKLQYKISSFYYANYEEIKQALHLPDRGPLRISPFSQMIYYFGVKIPSRLL